jgi:hypothetical protein
MKLFLDSKARRFVKSAASNVALQTLVLKRRDQVPIEIIFVENGVAVSPVAGTQTTVALKTSFSDSNFLALAAPGQTILDLNTLPVEAAFSSDPASIPAFLEIRWTAPTQALRTATLQVEIQNSVILGDEATPAAIPDGKATQAEAEAGLSNEKWMTPLRTAQAVQAQVSQALADANERIDDLLANFDPALIDSISEAVEVIGTEREERIAGDAALQTALTAEAATRAGADSTEQAARIAGDAALSTALSTETTNRTAALTAESSARTAAIASETTRATAAEQSIASGLSQEILDRTAGDAALSDRIDLLASNLGTESLDSIAEAAAAINTLQSQLDGKATAAQGALADTALQPEPVDYQGAYNNGADYYPGQVVSFNGELYIRIGEPNPGYPPPGSYWAAFDPSASPAFKLWVELSKADTIHTHTAADITDFAEAVVAVSPPVDWSSLTGKPTEFPPEDHTHLAADITDLASAVETLAPTPTTPANSGLAISGNSLATAYNSSIADGVVSVAVGGAPAAPASAWKAKNLVQVLDDILFPTILASVGSAKSITLGVSGASGVLEIGSSIARTLTATFGRGTILNGTGSTNSNPLVGDATGFTFTGTGISSTAQPGNALAFTTAVVSGSNNWAVTAAHAAGTGDYFDNKGVSGTNLAASRASGTATDSTSAPTITGVHPFYHFRSSSPISAAAMVAAIQNGTATKIIADSTGTLTIPYAPSAQYLAIAYPSTSTTKTRYFVTALDNGAITVVFAPVATLSVTTALWTQSYKIHTSAGALTNSAANIELRNS